MLSASCGKNGKKKSVFSFFDATHQMMHIQSAPQLLQLKKKKVQLCICKFSHKMTAVQ